MAATLRDWEREATGLPIDHDRNVSTQDQLSTRHPFTLTENGLRQEIGAAAPRLRTALPSRGISSRATGDNRGITEEDTL